MLTIFMFSINTKYLHSEDITYCLFLALKMTIKHLNKFKGLEKPYHVCCQITIELNEKSIT